jgi:triosephosphate isomerase (TIM)
LAIAKGMLAGFSNRSREIRIMTPGIKPLIAGNWKMNGLNAQLPELKAIREGFDAAYRARMDALLCVPFTLLAKAADVVHGSGVMGGAQDCHWNSSGAHTGDISAEMIADCGAGAIIVGHSERRADHGETSETVRAKAEAVLRAGLLPIVCIGETRAQREAGETLAVLGAQLEASLPGSAAIVVAYEPVWAIGTGLTPTADDVAQAHQFIRDFVVRRHGPAGNAIRLLYGGSVKPSNAAELLGVANVDGALVGGASLKAADFLGICAGCP